MHLVAGGIVDAAVAVAVVVNVVVVSAFGSQAKLELNSLPYCNYLVCWEVVGSGFERTFS